MITVNPLSTSTYDTLRDQMILDFEGEKPHVYTDARGFATIGIGFLVSAQATNILRGMGYQDTAGNLQLTHLAAAITSATQGVDFGTGIAGALAAQNAVNNAVNRVLGTTYSIANNDNFGYGGYSTGANSNFGYGNTGNSGLSADAQIQDSFNVIIETKETLVNQWLVDAPIGTPPQQIAFSTERAALVSLAYNGLIGFATNPQTGQFLFNPDGSYKLLSPALQHDLVTGDRAEAWYEIRYNSNKDSLNASAPADVQGVANRRYEESQVFGLFTNANAPGTAVPSWTEAVQAYQMLATHRDDILTYDALYGSALGQTPPSPSVNYDLLGSLGIQPVPTLNQALWPAETVLVQALQSQYGAILANLNLTNATDIYLNPGRRTSPQTVSSAYAATLDASFSPDNNLLVASTGGPTGLLTPDTGNGLPIGGQGHEARDTDTPRKRTPGHGIAPARRFAGGRKRQGVPRMLLHALLCVGVLAASSVRAAEGASAPVRSYHFPYSYHFTLTKGRHRPVCQADLQRLNTATYTGPPSCDQPKTTKVPGFTPLHRVPLSAKEVHRLFPLVTGFMESGKQISKAQEAANAALRKRLGLPPLDQWPFADVQSYVQQGDTQVWRYDPPVDIGNDGRPTNLVLWQGMPINGGPGTCGKPVSVGASSVTVYDRCQVAFVLAPGNDRLDTRTTKALFGHIRLYRLPNGTVLSWFEPIGRSIGVFQYRGLYYFDTFLGRWGPSLYQRIRYPALSHTLGVFLRRKGQTREVCAYHMTQRHINPNEQDTP